MVLTMALIGTLLWYGDHPYRAAIEEIKKIGFDYFELSLDYPLPEICDTNKLKTLIKDLGIGIAFHSPLDIFLAQPRREIFEASLKVFRKCLKFASNFETLYYNFHINWKSPTSSFLEVKGKIVENGIKACEEAVRLGEEHNFDVCLEYDSNFDERFLINGLKLTFDVGHFVVDEVKKNKNYMDSIKDFLNKFRDRIIAVHLHDCDICKLVDHLSFGKGDLNIEEIVGLVKDMDYILIETFWRDLNKDIISYSDLENNFNYIINLLK